MNKPFKARLKNFLPFLPAVVYVLALSFILANHSHTRKTSAEGLQLSAKYLSFTSDVIQQAQYERSLSIGFITNNVASQDLLEQRDKTDQAIRSLKNLPSSLNEDVKNVTSILISKLGEARAKVDRKGNHSDIIASFSDMIENLIRLTFERTKRFPLDGLETRLMNQSVLELVKEKAGMLRASIEAVLGMNSPISGDELFRISAYRHSISNIVSVAHLNVPNSAGKEIENILSSPDWLYVISVFEKVQARSSTGEYGESPTKFHDAISRVVNQIDLSIEKETKSIDTNLSSVLKEAEIKSAVYLLSAIIFAAIIMLLIIKTVNQISHKVSFVTNGLIEASTSLDSSSKKLLSGASSLDVSVTEEASSLQQTIVFLEEIRAMASVHMESTNSAKELTEENRVELNTGKYAINNMYSSIGDIQASNESIIKVASEI